MTKLMKVCLENEPPIGPEKCASAETLDKNKKTLIYLCLDVGSIILWDCSIANKVYG